MSDGGQLMGGTLTIRQVPGLGLLVLHFGAWNAAGSGVLCRARCWVLRARPYGLSSVPAPVNSMAFGCGGVGWLVVA